MINVIIIITITSQDTDKEEDLFVFNLSTTRLYRGRDKEEDDNNTCNGINHNK